MGAASVCRSGLHHQWHSFSVKYPQQALPRGSRRAESLSGPYCSSLEAAGEATAGRGTLFCCPDKVMLLKLSDILFAAARHLLVGARVKPVDCALRLDQVSSHWCVAPNMPRGRRCGPCRLCVLYRIGRCKPIRWHSRGTYQPVRVPPGRPNR